MSLCGTPLTKIRGSSPPGGGGVDGRPNRRKNAAFSNFLDVVCTEPRSPLMLTNPFISPSYRTPV